MCNGRTTLGAEDTMDWLARGTNTSPGLGWTVNLDILLVADRDES